MTSENRDVVFSEQGNTFFNLTKWFILIGLALLLGLFITLSKEFHHAFINLGLFFTFVGSLVFIPYFYIPQGTQYFRTDLAVQYFFEPLQYPLLASLSLGVFLLVIGLIIMRRKPTSIKRAEE